MLQQLLLFVAELVWSAAVLKWGVDTLSPRDNDRRERATIGAMVYATIFFLVLGKMSMILMVVFPLFVPLLWIAYAVAYLLLFSEYFGLGYKRAFYMIGVQAAGAMAWRFATWLLPVG